MKPARLLLLLALAALWMPTVATASDAQQVMLSQLTEAGGYARVVLNGEPAYLYVAVSEFETTASPGDDTASPSIRVEFFDNATWFATCAQAGDIEYTISPTLQHAALRTTVDCTESLPSVGIVALDVAWRGNPPSETFSDGMHSRFAFGSMSGTFTANGQTQALGETVDAAISTTRWHDVLRRGRHTGGAGGSGGFIEGQSLPGAECVLEAGVYNFIAIEYDLDEFRWVRDGNSVYHLRYTATFRTAVFSRPDTLYWPTIDDPDARYRGAAALDVRLQMTRPAPDESGNESHAIPVAVTLTGPDGSSQQVFIDATIYWFGDELFASFNSYLRCA